MGGKERLLEEGEGGIRERKEKERTERESKKKVYKQSESPQQGGHEPKSMETKSGVHSQGAAKARRVVVAEQLVSRPWKT